MLRVLVSETLSCVNAGLRAVLSAWAVRRRAPRPRPWHPASGCVALSLVLTCGACYSSFCFKPTRTRELQHKQASKS